MASVTSVSDKAKRRGFRVGDKLISLGGFEVRDTLDVAYFDSEVNFQAVIERDGKRKTLKIKKTVTEPLGIETDCELKPARCKNKCVFCFVDQLPAGMRDTLYIKDDDYRFSFISGSYVTLTNVSDADIDRIIRLKLSPLYISVHAVDDAVRLSMVKNPQTLKLIDRMRKLGEDGIKMHTQLVVVPGINDGDILCESITALKQIPGVESVAVVPVGLTRHREGLDKLKEVDAKNAAATIEAVEALNEKLGGFCWCSDEYYVKAGLETKPYEYYKDFPQIENGVGLIADFHENLRFALEECEKINLNKKIVFVTGVSFAPILEGAIAEVERKLGISAEVLGVANKFFGESVTVAGLLTAKDITEALSAVDADAAVIPDNMLREFTDVFLDNVSLTEVEASARMPIITVAHDGSDLPQRIIKRFTNNT